MTLMIPTFLYGTAWKEDDTERLVRLAIDAGFAASTPRINGVTTSKPPLVRGSRRAA